MTSTYGLLADFVLITHFLFVLFVLTGFFLVVAGGVSGWEWIRNSWFRVLHLTGILVVTAQSWLGMICPLTTLEMWLRGQAGGSTYEASFVQHWVGQLLYYNAPDWVFMFSYTVFGILVLVTLFVYPPHFFRRGNSLGA